MRMEPHKLPAVRAVLFDTDGVLLDTAVSHAAAWKKAFDACLASPLPGPPQPAFDAEGEYRALVDGKSRFDGARAFLRARGVDLPAGTPGDPPGCATVWAVAAAKDRALVTALRDAEVPVFADTVPALRALRRAGLRLAAVSASRHARSLLASAGLVRWFDTVLDGEQAARLALPGKPDPALFLAAAHRLGVVPGDSALVEDAVAGVKAGRRGGFALVVGVDRRAAPGTAAALRHHGAGVVVRDLTDLARRLGACDAVGSGRRGASGGRSEEQDGRGGGAA
ncbi:HAD family hydrolase [Streptomyces sp. NBC_01216]|uniref:HAD family hydrolase n=1 Tax=Streptomyces sp. NBC_01216 TaxID=2903778 RepID=UPI003FA3B0D3